MEDCQKFDNAFFSVLEECKELPSFLDAIFGFLSRRTDFYCIAEGPHSPVGLPEGFAEELVRRTFMKWKPKPCKILTETKHVPEPQADPICEVEVSEEIVTTAVACQEKQDRQESIIFTKSDSYNGAVYDNYSWSQSISEVDIRVKIPENISKKQLCIEIKTKNISVRLKNSSTVILEGELCQKCKSQEAIWSLDQTNLQIHLEKAMEAWWDCLTLSEPKLDFKKMDCSRPYEELTPEAQAKIEELTWNQERKRLGLPTSDELQMNDKLKKAWNAQGSPFTGPFNPDSVLMN